MKTLNDIQNVNSNAANVASYNNKINDFGQKIGGARKDLYTAAREWAEKLADITADKLAAVGLSKLVKLPNLESMAAAGVISADQARAALTVWRSIEAKPARSWRVSGWADRTREKLEIVAAVLTAEDPAAICETLSAAPEYKILTAANWPAEAFTFGRYSVGEYESRPQYIGQAAARYFRIFSGRYSVGEKSGEAANIAAQLREMTAADAEKAAESRARGPRLGVYHTSDYTRYFIAVQNKCEIVLKVCDTYQEAAEAVRTERAELLKRYEDLKTFPALRRSWNRPRVGKEWHAEDVTPEQFAAVLPFKGVEFGNWLNQDERAALLNSAFDGFHDLADLLGIPAEAVALGGMLNFSFATRGHAGSAAHFDSCYNTINLNKRNGAGCMAHEWLHACDHYAAVLAGRGSCTSWGEAFATECRQTSDHPADIAARELIAAIKTMDYYTRSRNYQVISGKSQGGADYYTQPCELAARGFEGVALYLLNCAGGCSDFLVNLEDWKTFEMNDAGHRRDCYPYPSDAEAAALLPYYMKFFRALFGRCEVSQKAAEGIESATAAAIAEKAEADSRAAEQAEKERQESEARREAQRAKWQAEAKAREAEQERKAAEAKAKAEATRAAIVERLTAAHFDTIATDCDAAAVYFAAHLEGEIYTGKAEIKSTPAEVAATVQAAPVACVSYKYVHNAKRIICRRWQVASVRSNKRTARELVESLEAGEVRQVVRTFADFEKVETWQAAEKLWADTQRLHEEQTARARQDQPERPAADTKPAEGEAVSVAENGPEGLQLVTIPGGVAVVGTADTEKARGRQTYRARREIKAHGATWNHAANQWQATTPEAVAALRKWFGVSETPAETVSETPSEGTAPAVAPTLESLQEITETAEALTIAASYDEGAPLERAGEIESRQKPATWQDKPAAELLPEDLPAELLKFYEVNSEATDENPAPVCLFYVQGHGIYEAFGSDAHTLAQEFGAGVITFSTETEYKHGKKFPAPIDYADFKADELSDRVAWLTREGYAVAIFPGPDCLPTYCPAKDTSARRGCHYSEVTELGDGITREIESTRNLYDFHFDIMQRYYKNGELLAMFHASGYPGEWQYIGTLRPPYAGRFSNGNAAERFGTIWQAERFMLAEIKAGGLTPYRRPETAAVAVCHSYETGAPCYSTSEKSEPTRNQKIAKIILQQLGGGQFAMMTGAKNFAAIDNGVRFHIGKNKTRANVVKIILRGDDTYNMEFWHIGQEVNPYTILMRYANKGLSEEEFNKQVKAATERAEKAAEPVKLKAYDGIYCDQLQELFTQYTELYTRLF